MYRRENEQTDLERHFERTKHNEECRKIIKPCDMGYNKN